MESESTILADIATTCTHNLTRNAKTPARFERAAAHATTRLGAGVYHVQD